MAQPRAESALAGSPHQVNNQQQQRQQHHQQKQQQITTPPATTTDNKIEQGLEVSSGQNK